jgi:hypothetical protein
MKKKILLGARHRCLGENDHATSADAGQFCKFLRQTFQSERIKNSARVSIQVCGEKNQTGSSCSRPEKESVGDTFFHRAIGRWRSSENPDRDYDSDSVEDGGAEQIGDAEEYGVLVERGGVGRASRLVSSKHGGPDLRRQALHYYSEPNFDLQPGHFGRVREGRTTLQLLQVRALVLRQPKKSSVAPAIRP